MCSAKKIKSNKSRFSTFYCNNGFLAVENFLKRNVIKQFFRFHYFWAWFMGVSSFTFCFLFMSLKHLVLNSPFYQNNNFFYKKVIRAACCAYISRANVDERGRFHKILVKLITVCTVSFSIWKNIAVVNSSNWRKKYFLREVKW